MPETQLDSQQQARPHPAQRALFAPTGIATWRPTWTSSPISSNFIFFLRAKTPKWPARSSSGDYQPVLPACRSLSGELVNNSSALC